MSDLSNPYAHLTNTSINKASPTIDDSRGFVGAGCKRTFADLRKCVPLLCMIESIVSCYLFFITSLCF